MSYRIKEKATNRTWMMYGCTNGLRMCIGTGHKVFIAPGSQGYSEFNDRGEPVLDSWIKQELYVIIKDG